MTELEIDTSKYKSTFEEFKSQSVGKFSLTLESFSELWELSGNWNTRGNADDQHCMAVSNPKKPIRKSNLRVTTNKMRIKYEKIRSSRAGKGANVAETRKLQTPFGKFETLRDAEIAEKKALPEGEALSFTGIRKRLKNARYSEYFYINEDNSRDIGSGVLYLTPGGLMGSINEIVKLTKASCASIKKLIDNPETNEYKKLTYDNGVLVCAI